MCNLGEALLEEGRQEGREEGRQEERENTLREAARADAAEERAYKAEKENEYLKKLLEAEYPKVKRDLQDRKSRHSGKKREKLWHNFFKSKKPLD